MTSVRRRIAERVDEALADAGAAIDDTGLLKYGKASPCVARQYTGTAGKVTNRQVAVSVSLVTETASCPVDWRLALTMVDELLGWGLRPSVLVADAG